MRRRIGPRCNCRHWTCLVDSALHALNAHWSWICDRHDAYILNERAS